MNYLLLWCQFELGGCTVQPVPCGGGLWCVHQAVQTGILHGILLYYIQSKAAKKQILLKTEFIEQIFLSLSLILLGTV